MSGLPGCIVESHSRRIPPGLTGSISTLILTDSRGGEEIAGTIRARTNREELPEIAIDASLLVKEFASLVYANPRYIEALKKSTPIADHVFVDFEQRGCPINKHQLLEVISAYLNNRKPNISHTSVCTECKRAGNLCVMVAHGTPCLGPVTHAGCGAICPSYNRGCYGCFGPKETPNPPALSARLAELGVGKDDLVRAFRGFNAYSEAFHRESLAHDTKNH